ncbi:MAG: hypothetical protein GXY34_01170 [Syntrophomonadaceae bacterium]|nr:hypothetical protein [Syntrophomonadaceae bacterium]
MENLSLGTGAGYPQTPKAGMNREGEASLDGWRGGGIMVKRWRRETTVHPRYAIAKG